MYIFFTHLLFQIFTRILLKAQLPCAYIICSHHASRKILELTFCNGSFQSCLVSKQLPSRWYVLGIVLSVRNRHAQKRLSSSYIIPYQPAPLNTGTLNNVYIIRFPPFSFITYLLLTSYFLHDLFLSLYATVEAQEGRGLDYFYC